RLHRARLSVCQYLAKLSKGRRVATLTLHASAEEPRQPGCRRLFAALSDYMVCIIYDSLCAQMGCHIHDCIPCQAFLSSLKSAVEECRSYRPQCDSKRAEQLGRDLLPKYQQ